MADVHSAARKPQMYKDPVTGKTKVRMVPSKQDVKSEKTLTPAEKRGRERIAKKLPMKDFEKRYGDDAMQVKMATATKIAKKKYDGDNETTGVDETKGVREEYTNDDYKAGKQTVKVKSGDRAGETGRVTGRTWKDGKMHFTVHHGGDGRERNSSFHPGSNLKIYKESVEEHFNWKVSHAGKDVHVKAPHAGAAVKKAQKGFGNIDLTKAKITNLGKVGTPASDTNESVDENYSYQPGKRVIGKASDEPDTGPRNTYLSKRMRDNEKARQALKDPDHNPAWANSTSKIEATDKPPFDEPYTKKDEPKRDQFGNVVKKKNIASFLAKKAIKKQMGEDKQEEGLLDRTADVKTRAQRAKSAMRNGMPRHVALAKYMVSTKDIETHTEAKVDETSDDFKRHYVDKAKSDYKHQQFSRDIAKDMGADKDTLNHYTRKMQKRMAGIGRAVATMKGESVEEANDNWERNFKKRIALTVSGGKKVQDYMKTKVDQKKAAHAKQDPRAVKQNYGPGVIPPGTAYRAATKRGMTPSQAANAVSNAFKNRAKPRKLPEETQLDEMKANAAYTKAAKDIKAYAAKDGGIDKKDMMNFAADLELMGRAPNILQAGRILDRINTRFKGYDTDVRDRLSMYLKKHGLME